jgi:hypothetical protein
MLKATYPTCTDTQLSRKEVTQMIKLTLRYTRYAFSALATIAFGWSTN